MPSLAALVLLNFGREPVADVVLHGVPYLHVEYPAGEVPCRPRADSPHQPKIVAVSGSIGKLLAVESIGLSYEDSRLAVTVPQRSVIAALRGTPVTAGAVPTNKSAATDHPLRALEPIAICPCLPAAVVGYFGQATSKVVRVPARVQVHAKCTEET